MIAVIDYGVGNLYSLVSSLSIIDADICVTADAEVLKRADKIILPGVGAFGDAKQKLSETGLIQTLYEQCGRDNDNANIAKIGKFAKPLLGICLGMQLLFEKSYEYGNHDGLGFIKGEVVKFDLPQTIKVPHMGWNSLDFLPYSYSNNESSKSQTVSMQKHSDNCNNSYDKQKNEKKFSSLFSKIKNGDYVYFVHSYYAKNCKANTIATSHYGIDITAAVQNKNIFGTQFHPEKSGDVGLNILRAFCEL